MEMVAPSFDELINDALEDLAGISSLIIDEDDEADLRLTLEWLAQRVREATLEDLDLAQLLFM